MHRARHTANRDIIQMPKSFDILALIAADLPGLDAILGALGAATINWSTARTLDQALDPPDGFGTKARR